MICEVAPAKINLTLEILGKRKDGYHEIRSVMQTIDLCDVLTFWDNQWIHLVPEYGSLPGNDTLSNTDRHNYMGKNLVYRAAMALKQAAGYKGGALIQLKKYIPSSAGLGGGSSDAAAALKGLNRLWKLGLSQSELIEIGSSIGSDIAFFIHGGTCLIEGRGEIVKPISPLPRKWILVLLIPLVLEQKTKMLYSYIGSSHYTAGENTESLCRVLGGCRDDENRAMMVKDSLFNVFEKVYHNGYKEFGSWKEHIGSLGIRGLSLAGSGPAVYCISDSREELFHMADRDLAGGDPISKYIVRTVP
jgi:4-diphosphocytidyl-2-C-methyl-D-erythritol kinase